MSDLTLTKGKVYGSDVSVGWSAETMGATETADSWANESKPESAAYPEHDLAIVVIQPDGQKGSQPSIDHKSGFK